MRGPTIGLILSLISICVSAQPETIDNKVIKMGMDTSSDRSSFFCNHVSNSDTSLLENLSCWIYAKSNGQDYLSIQKGINYNDITHGLESSSSNKFRKVTAISQPQISNHKHLFSKDNYAIPPNIMQWPGSFEQEAIASFVDVNQNSKYDPENGDYPFIRGDQCLVSISHDQLNRTSTLPAINTSLVQYYFIFPNSGDPVLDNTVGFRWVLRNNSNISYDTTMIGVQFHALLNKLNNNYIGTDVGNNALFVYESNVSNSQYVSVVLLNRVLTNTMYFKNTGQTSNKNDIPLNQNHYINYLQSRWKDGDTLKLGSTGLDGDSSISFVFPNTTIKNYSPWTENIVGNQGGDRNGVMTCQFTNWKPGEYQVIEGAILYQEGVDSLPELYRRHEMLRNVYQNTQFSSLKKWISSADFRLYPNPANNKRNITIESKRTMSEIKAFDISGSIILSKKVDSKKTQINQSNLGNQTIFIQVTYDDGTSKTKALVVQ